MNVLLIDPPSTKGKVLEATDRRSKLPSPNMGLIYLGTYLMANSEATVKIIDPQMLSFSEGTLHAFLKKFRPSLVGISAKTFNILGAYYAARIVKEVTPESLVVAGGAHPTALSERTLQECLEVDAVVLREGEITFLEIYNRLAGGWSVPDELFSDIVGLVWRSKEGVIQHNGERELIKDLDSLPFPDFSMVDYTKYARVYNPERRKFQHMYPVFGSRGCPFNCTFCMPLLTRKHRVRSIEKILDEVELIHRKHGAERVYFEDSLFCSSKSWFSGFL